MFTIITIAAPLCGFGIAQWWLKISGQFQEYAIFYIKKSLYFSFTTTMLIFLLLSSWFILTSNNSLLALSGVLLTCMIFSLVTTELISSLLQIKQRYLLLSCWGSIQPLLLLMIATIYIYITKSSLSLLSIGLFYFIASIVISSINVFFITKYIKVQCSMVAQEDQIVPSAWEIAKEAAPFGMAGLFYLIYYQIGIVYVNYMLGSEDAGYYSVAFTFLSIALFVPGIIYQKFLIPKLHNWAYQNPENLSKSYVYGNYIMLSLGFTIAILLYFLAPYFITYLFGTKYILAIPLLKLMIINIPIVYLASSSGSILVTRDNMKKKVLCMCLTACISMILNPILIYYFHSNGAIYTNICCNLILLTLYLNIIKKAGIIQK